PKREVDAETVPTAPFSARELSSNATPKPEPHGTACQGEVVATTVDAAKFEQYVSEAIWRIGQQSDMGLLIPEVDTAATGVHVELASTVLALRTLAAVLSRRVPESA